MKTNVFVGKDDIENEFTFEDGINLIKGGYDKIVLEATPVTYKLVRSLLKKFDENKIECYLEFPAVWKHEQYDYSTLEEFVDIYNIEKIFVRVFEDRVLDHKLIAEELAHKFYHSFIYLYGAISGLDFESTNICKISKELEKICKMGNPGYAPIIFTNTPKPITKEWIPVLFLKNCEQDEFDKTLTDLSESYDEIIVFPYKNIYDMKIEKEEKKPVYVSNKMKCNTEIYSRVYHYHSAPVVKLLAPGDIYDILEKYEENEYNVFGRIGTNEWVYTRRKGVNTFDPIEE